VVNALDVGLVDAEYTMLMDVMYEVTIRNRSTGQTTREWYKRGDDEIPEQAKSHPDWSLPGSIRCFVRGILGGGIRVVGSTTLITREDFEEVDWAKARVLDKTITKRHRVTNIRDEKTGEVLWINDKGEPLTFIVMGRQPVLEPFSRPEDYELLLKGETGD
jgi:hypothetical protein